MLILHIANKNYSSWSLRPWALLRARSIPFREQMHFFEDRGDERPFRQFSPSARVPCLHDGEAVVWDSLAIVEYLAERHGGIWPGDSQARAWSRCACAEMHSGFSELRSCCSMNVGVRIRLHALTKGLEADLRRLEELWSDGLGRFGGPWLGGAPFSAVDAYFAPVAFRIQTYGLDLQEPCRSYAQRLLAHPALRAWEADALLETQRDPAHEQAIAGSGVLLTDQRCAA